MKAFVLVFPFLFVFIFSACSKYPDNVTLNLEKAGDNKKELLKVLEHYEGDEEKLSAVYFLIGNIDEKSSRIGDFSAHHRVYDYVDSLNDLNISLAEVKELAGERLNEIEKRHGAIEQTPVTFNLDLRSIKADYLINNIDLAFDVWKNKPWCKDIGFDTFCNFILPYRIHDEPLSDFRSFFIEELKWLEDSLKDPSNLNEACLLVNNYMYDKYTFIEKLGIMPFPTAIDMYKFGAGDCELRYFLFISAMRSVGIPVASDFSLQWNHWPGNHSWVTLVNNDSIVPFNAGEYYEAFPTEIVIPIGMQTSSTVFRHQYAKVEDTPLGYEESKYFVPENLRNEYMKNVSSQYKYPMTPLDLAIDEDKKKEQTLYLGCFGYGEEIVAVDYMKHGADKFENIGKCGIYIPFYFKNNKMEYASYPFILSCDGYEKWYSNPLMDQMEKITVTRKFDIQDSMRVFGNAMIGSYFEMSNDKNFGNSERIYTIEKAPIDFAEATVSSSKVYRYIRYVSEKERINLAELEFYEDTVKLQGSVLSNTNTTEKNLFDGDIRTNHIASAGSWVGMDFGSQQKVTTIRYLPRNNFNIIEVGDVYELLYFDYEWKSLGIEKATTNKLQFEAPKYALLLLKNLTKGREERIFKYENDMQIFW